MKDKLNSLFVALICGSFLIVLAAFVFKLIIAAMDAFTLGSCFGVAFSAAAALFLIGVIGSIITA